MYQATWISDRNILAIKRANLIEEFWWIQILIDGLEI